MISLVAPGAGEDRYVWWYMGCIGPFDQALKFTGEVINLPELSTMTQSRGIWHENNVLHDKISGDVQYHPLVGGIIPSPTAQYPDRILVPVYNYAGQATTYYANVGYVSDHWVGRNIVTNTTVWAVAFERDPLDKSVWNCYRIGTNIDPHEIQYAYKYRIKSVTKIDSIYAYYSEEQTTYLVPSARIKTGLDWRETQPFSAVKSIIDSLPIASVVVRATTNQWYKARVPSTSVFSPSQASEHINTIAKQLVPDHFPLPDVPYGDLAMKASEKVNANRVNMIAFLRDLRHPTEMIPKLRNLAKLKTIADNFLTVEYGILPTVSDIQSIVGAFYKMKPFLDRNGFSVYNARSSDSMVQDDKSYTLEQRIKLAIGYEDNEFLALLQRLDSMGTLPTFERIWDLVPYSFVVDWFIDVGGLLERLDAGLRLMRLDIRYATMSRKVSVTGNLTVTVQTPYSGSVKWEQYHRWVSDQCPVPPLSLQSTSGDFNHWLESGALLLQRFSH